MGVWAFVLLQTPNILRDVLKPWLGEAGSWTLFAGVYLLAMLALGYPILRDRRARRMRAKDFALVDGGFGDQFPVEVTVVAAGKRLGTDRGVLWFDDGLMGFSGAALSFVLASCDVVVKRQGQKTSRQGKGYPDGAVALVRSPREAYVVVHALGRQAKECQARLRRFAWEPVNREAERHWPPLIAYEEAQRTERMIRDALQ